MITFKIINKYIDINFTNRWIQSEITFIKIFVDQMKYKTAIIRVIITLLNFELYLRIR